VELLEKKELRKKKIQKALNPAAKKRAKTTANQKNKIKWIQCDDCLKWRKHQPNLKVKRNKKFNCEQIQGINCRTKQENDFKF